MIINNLDNLFVVKITNENMANAKHKFNLDIGDQVIFDMSLEAKENTLAMVENEYGDYS